MSELKKEFLELLEKDTEFRYAVAGYIGLLEIFKRLDRLEEGQNKLWENQNRLWEEVKSLREDFRSMKKTLERITISEEEEASEVVSYRLEKETGIKIKFQKAYVGDKEINFYATTEDTCIIGEVTTRLGTKLVNELEEKIQIAKKLKPELLKPKMIKFIYTIMAAPEAIEQAKEHGIWILNWKEGLTPIKTHQTT